MGRQKPGSTRKATDAYRGPRLITRYDNRKLYDAQAGRYVTLEDLRAQLAAGEDVEVVDQKTGEDLTTLTLAQILLEGLRGSTARVPRQVLTRLIRLAFGPVRGWGDWAGPQEAAVRAREEAERIVGKLLSKGRLTLDEALALRQEVSGSVQHIVADAQAGIEDRLRALLAPNTEGPTASLLGLKDRIDSFTTLVKGRASTTRGQAAPRKGRTTAASKH